MRRVRALLVCSLSGLLLCAPAIHAAVVITGDPEDVSIRPGGTITLALSKTVLGSSTNFPDSGHRSIVYVFKLPTSDTGSYQVQKANFKFTVASVGDTPSYNVDLYALPARTSPTVLNTDNRSYNASPSPGIQIFDNLLPAGIPFPLGEVSTDFANPIDPIKHVNSFVDFLSTQYGPDGSLGVGKYIFLRLNPDGANTPTEDSGGNVFMGESSTGAPTLTLQFVPEPSLALAGSATFLTISLLRRPRTRV